MNDIQQQVESLVIELMQDAPVTVLPDTDLFEAGILDSFRVIEFLTELEKRFNISIPTDELIPQNLWTIEATVRTVRRHLDRGTGA